MKLCAYTKYKDAGIDWIGNVPTQWQFKRLKYCADLINEKVDGSETEVPYTGLEHVESWMGKRIVAENGSAKSEGQANRFKAGDVLFGKLRPYLAKVLRSKDEGICTGELLVLRPKAVIQDYLFNYLLSKDFITIVDSSTYGSKMPRAGWEFIGNLPMLLPPEEEQRAIAFFLNLETGRIDQLIARKERQIELLKEKRSALISYAVTKGLNPKAKMKDSGIEWVGDIPEHWDAVPVKRQYEIQLGKMLQNNPSSESDISVSYIKALHVLWGEVDTSDLPDMWASPADLKQFRVKSGDLLVCEGGEAGRAAIVDSAPVTCIIQNALHRVREKGADVRYLQYVLQTVSSEGWFDVLCNKATIAHFTREKLANLRMPLPPSLEEQRAISSFLDRETARIDALVEKVRKSIELLREYRTALISAAVTGKIDVRKEAA